MSDQVAPFLDPFFGVKNAKFYMNSYRIHKLKGSQKSSVLEKVLERFLERFLDELFNDLLIDV